MNNKKIFTILFILIFGDVVFGQSSKIYYPDYGDDISHHNVYYSNLDGQLENYFTVDIRAKTIAVDANSSPQKLYIGLTPISSGNGKIIRCNTDGTVQEDVVTDVVGINDIELDLVNRKIYWLKNTYNENYIYKADMDGTNSNVTSIYHTTVANCDLWGLAINADTQTLWITERGSTYNGSYIRRMTTAGGSVTTIMNPVYNPHDIEYYNDLLYAGTNDGVVSMHTDGSGQSVLVADANVDGIAVDGLHGKIYWVDFLNNRVKYCNLDGTEEAFVSNPHIVLFSVAVDYNFAELPVELTSFTAASRSSATGEPIIVLQWQTATEVNNYGFEIQRSEQVEGGKEDFVTIGFVGGSGNSNSIKNYFFTDNLSPSPNFAFTAIIKYRLKQIDSNGQFEYSEIIEANIENELPDKFGLSQNYPNPFNPATAISFNLPINSFVTLKVFNAMGEEVTTLVRGALNPGIHNINFDAGKLTSGIYFYRLSAGNFIQTKKMILMR